MTFPLSIWLTVFAVGNAMDVCTTLLCEALPEEYKGRELNPMVTKSVREKFKRMLAFKVLAVTAFIGCCLVPSIAPSLIVVQVLAVVLWLVVVNNFYVYIVGRVKKRRAWTPGSFLVDKLHIQKCVAYYIYVAVLLGVSYLLVGTL